MEEFKKFILDLIFPRRCLGCGILLSKEPSYLCLPCLATITFKNTFSCAFCNSPVLTGRTCQFCRPGHFLDRLLVATSYENPLVEKILKTVKYRFIKTLADEIAGLMAKYLEGGRLPELKSGSNNIITAPVPLHRLRLNWRGFNQSEIIAAALAERFRLDFKPRALFRMRASLPQAEIANRGMRIENIKNIFECPDSAAVQGKTILLIDDVSTTGSTLDDCARALKGAGAKEVIGFVFARG